MTTSPIQALEKARSVIGILTDALAERDAMYDSSRNHPCVSEALTAIESALAGGKEEDAEAKFIDTVWSALKGDHNDLRRQQIILGAFREALTAADSKGGAETGWLIEAKHRSHSSYFCGDYGARWTDNVNEAVRFARQIDAFRAASYLDMSPKVDMSEPLAEDYIYITAHTWVQL